MVRYNSAASPVQSSGQIPAASLHVFSLVTRAAPVRLPAPDPRYATSKYFHGTANIFSSSARPHYVTGVRWVSASTVQVSWLARGGGETHTLYTITSSGEVTTSQVSSEHLDTGHQDIINFTKFDVMVNKNTKLSCQ